MRIRSTKNSIFLQQLVDNTPPLPVCVGVAAEVLDLPRLPDQLEPVGGALAVIVRFHSHILQNYDT
jgi:hypothetical protein